VESWSCGLQGGALSAREIQNETAGFQKEMISLRK
jgi:hypothetical protein